VVTGSNKGIGRGIIETLCKVLSKNEWAIYLTARNVELGKKTVSELEHSGLSVNFHQLDINCKDSRNTLREYVKNKYGGVDILINNAGIAYKQDSTTPFAEQAEVTMETNFFNTLKMCQEFIPILKQNSRLVNVSSMMTQMTLKKLGKQLYDRLLGPMTMKELEDCMHEFVRAAKENTLEQHGWANSAYGVSKIGVTKMTSILSDEIKGDSRNILINCCCPGYVDTDMTSHKGHLTIYQGADTPTYLATLPEGNMAPSGKFLSERKIVEFK